VNRGFLLRRAALVGLEWVWRLAHPACGLSFFDCWHTQYLWPGTALTDGFLNGGSSTILYDREGGGQGEAQEKSNQKPRKKRSAWRFNAYGLVTAPSGPKVWVIKLDGGKTRQRCVNQGF